MTIPTGKPLIIPSTQEAAPTMGPTADAAIDAANICLKPEDSARFTPAFLADGPVNIWGSEGRRLMVVYRAVGCEDARNGMRCSMCNFLIHADPAATEDGIRRQHRAVLSRLSKGDIHQVDLMNSGSFFNDREISPDLREHLLSSLRDIPSIRRVLVESRREYVSAEKLIHARSCLREDQGLIFAFGYETANEHLRNKVLCKRVPEAALDDCLDMCRKAAVDLAAYLLVKPPSLSERQGIEDAVASIMHLFRKADAASVRTMALLEPVFVAPQTIVSEEALAGRYRPPSLWSLIEILERAGKGLNMEDAGGRLYVGLSDENLSDGKLCFSCPSCAQPLFDAIQAFNGHQRIDRLAGLSCACRDLWMQEIVRRP